MCVWCVRVWCLVWVCVCLVCVCVGLCVHLCVVCGVCVCVGGCVCVALVIHHGKHIRHIVLSCLYRTFQLIDVKTLRRKFFEKKIRTLIFTTFI
jgi:hypothetical protein